MTSTSCAPVLLFSSPACANAAARVHQRGICTADTSMLINARPVVLCRDGDFKVHHKESLRLAQEVHQPDGLHQGARPKKKQKKNGPPATESLVQSRWSAVDIIVNRPDRHAVAVPWIKREQKRGEARSFSSTFFLSSIAADPTPPHTHYTPHPTPPPPHRTHKLARAHTSPRHILPPAPPTAGTERRERTDCIVPVQHAEWYGYFDFFGDHFPRIS